MRLGVAGAGGRMGRLLVAAIKASPATLVGGIDRGEIPAGVPRFADIDALAAQCDVVIDFTLAECVVPHARALAAARTGWVLGTTGLDEAACTAVRQASAGIGIVQAANFSVGVALVMALAERMGAALPADAYDVGIMEMHHRQKLDAPSGTALALGEAVARGRDTAAADIGFASLRGGQIVGEHTVSFTAAGEQITLSHRAFDRAAFAQGALRAALWLNNRPAGVYGMAEVVG